MYETEVRKNGETFLQTVVERCKRGMKVTVTSHPKLEEFFQVMSAPHETVQVGQYGREWSLHNHHDGHCYELIADALIGIKHSPAGHYRLDKLGKPLLLNETDPNTGSSISVINLSFLRFVGLSSGQGVTFEMANVCTKDSIKTLARDIGEVSRAFYEQYIRNVKMVVTVSTSEVPSTQSSIL